MQQLDGFAASGKEDYVCLLKRYLYGLKQSPRQWYKRFDLYMVSHDFRGVALIVVSSSNNAMMIHFYICSYMLMTMSHFYICSYMLMTC